MTSQKANEVASDGRYPTAVRYPLVELLKHPEIKAATTNEAPAEQCTWCQMEGALCAVTITWLPRPDVLSDGSAECCLSCVRSPLRWALDDALTGSLVQVEISAGVAA